jgi:hypothetical protein
VSNSTIESPAAPTSRTAAVRGLLGRHPTIHPLLFAAFPVVYLWAHNLSQGVTFHDALGPLAVTMSAALVLTVLGAIALKDGRKAALIISILVVFFFSYGYIYSGLAGDRVAGVDVGRHTILLPVWSLLALGAIGLVLRARNLVRLTSALNVIAGGLVLLNLVSVTVFDLRPNPSGAAVLRAGDIHVPAVTSGGGEGASPLAHALSKHPDVYYIVLEEYAGQRALREEYRFDNTPFLSFLEDKGFFVGHQSTTNYPRTVLSLASSLNLDYLEDVAEQYGPDTGDTTPLTALLQDPEIGRVMKSLGYRFIQLGSWWEPTADSPSADVNLPVGGLSEFSQALYGTTALAPVAQDDSRVRAWKGVQFQFKALTQLSKFKGPRFVFAHIITPHNPYVFNRDGSYVTPKVLVTRTTEENYVNQLSYANAAVKKLVSRLLDEPEDKRPVIIVQSDEGPYQGEPTGWARYSARVMERKFGILSALYLPGVTDSDKATSSLQAFGVPAVPGEPTALPATITPVNTFRLVLDLYFGANLPLLPDRNFVFRDLDHIYDFTEVTTKVRALEAGSGPSG